MATDLNITIECPECGRPIKLRTQAVQEPGQLFLTFDTAPVRQHVAAHHSQEAGMPEADAALPHDAHGPGEHHLSWEHGVRPAAEPSRTEWAEHERDGTMHVECCCGLDTGWTSRDEAMRLYREHLGAVQP